MSENLDNWIERISENELPIFKYTVHAINDVVSKDATSISDLSRIILRDANLTARVLRVANSATYNVTGSTISTISRAIVYLGFNLVRDISMSLAIIDALLSGKAKEHALELMAKSFHAAVQARDFAERRGDDAAEEIFIAALLKHIGEITFWCVAGEEGEQIVELIENRGFSEELAQQEVLGFTLAQLTVGLTADWHISDLLHSAINKPKMDNPRIQDIVSALDLSDAAHKGWTNKETLAIANKIAKHIDVEEDNIIEILHVNAKKAAEVAQLFGASSIIKYLPIEEKNINEDADEHSFNANCPSPDPLLQLNILRDLSGMLSEKPDFNLILEIILEGIYRGVGLDRTLFAMLTADKKAIKGKYALGKDNQGLIHKFHFSLQTDNVFSKLVSNREPMWVENTQSHHSKILVSDEIRLVLACRAFYVAPLVIAERVIGLIYADRQPSDRELDSESFESFKHFVQQANQALEYIRR
ncbi:MAG: HDOD domain-containing protein [Gammaproteobacteria bacterium]|nr:HDOD domain-containing protein [Gammaproteobacteria bacterium]MCW9030865.1 HDOD domain-containing protein [Gammaproteobacteria bacterium]